MAKLTEKQRRAAQERLRGASMKDAYAAAYSTENMTEESVKQKGYQLFRKPHVAAYLENLQEQAEQQAIMDRKETLMILSEIARGNVADYLDKNGDIDCRKLVQANRDLESAQIQHTHEGVHQKIKLRNPIQAIERLAKMQGWDAEAKLEVEGVQFVLNMGKDDVQ